MEWEETGVGQIAQAHEFKIICMGRGRKQMDLPEYWKTSQRLVALQEQVTADEQKLVALEQQNKAI